MARGDIDRVEDILAAINDIRSDTAGLDFALFAAKPLVIPPAIIYDRWYGGDRRRAARAA